MESSNKVERIDPRHTGDNIISMSMCGNIEGKNYPSGCDKQVFSLENNNMVDMTSDDARMQEDNIKGGINTECDNINSSFCADPEEIAQVNMEITGKLSFVKDNKYPIGCSADDKNFGKSCRRLEAEDTDSNNSGTIMNDNIQVGTVIKCKINSQNKTKDISVDFTNDKIKIEALTASAKMECVNNNNNEGRSDSTLHLTENTAVPTDLDNILADQKKISDTLGADNTENHRPTEIQPERKSEILRDFEKDYEKLKEEIKNEDWKITRSPTGSGGGQVVVKDQVKAVVGDLENVLGELKTVVGDLKVLVDQIDAVTNKIDEEYGAEVQNVDSRVVKKSKNEELFAERRRRSASVLETGTPKRELPAQVRHSLSQPFDAIRTNKDWVMNAPADTAAKQFESPRHSHHSNGSCIRRKDELSQAQKCQVHSAKLNEAFSSPKKDDIIICTPGSVCQKMEALVGTSTVGRRKLSATDIGKSPSKSGWPNSPVVRTPTHLSRTPTRTVNKLNRSPSQQGRSPSKSGSIKSQSPCTPRNSRTKLTSPQTSNSSGIGNSNESGNGNTFTYPATKSKYIQERISTSDNVNKSAQNETSMIKDCSGAKPLNKPTICDGLPSGNEISTFHCTPCSPSPDSDYCGVYEKELELKLELVFEDELDNDEDRRTLNLQTYPGYGSTYDKERVSRWAAYTLVNIGTYSLTDDQFPEGVSETSSDILNDNSVMSLTPGSEDEVFLGAGQRRCLPWPIVFRPSCDQSVPNPDTG